HGNAIASLLAQEGAERIWIADIFSGEGGFSDSEAILKALGWLVRSEVGTINMSLTGPDDPILKVVVESINQKGHMIVAAVGNQGPEGPPQYPAAYDDVIAVTAIDSDGKIYEKANQGDYVDVAALGVNVIAASTQGSQAYSGTSFACPVIAANLAKILSRPEKVNATMAKKQLYSQLTDLGAKGFDPTFGSGALLKH
ncbi:MAG: S8 family serine peptidase, partial [Enterobacterales bacterium]|nr:S8 family serine peptidase [Enterobacterales bacterium]